MPTPRPGHHPQPAKLSKVDLIDFVAFREGTDVIAAGEERVQIDFPALKDVITNIRVDPTWKAEGWVPAQLQIALLSIDTKSEGQQRVVEALGRNFSVDPSYYRDNSVSAPPGRHPSEIFDREKGQRPIFSVASRLAYAVGRLSCHPDPQVLVVTHCFELFYPLTHLARSNPNARVGLAFFASLLDQRWKHAGLFDADFGVRFFDLDPFASRIFGGIDLTGRRQPSSLKKSGLDLI